MVLVDKIWGEDLEVFGASPTDEFVLIFAPSGRSTASSSQGHATSHSHPQSSISDLSGLPQTISTLQPEVMGPRKMTLPWFEKRRGLFGATLMGSTVVPPADLASKRTDHCGGLVQGRFLAF
jgi:hypothetical protein